MSKPDGRWWNDEFDSGGREGIARPVVKASHLDDANNCSERDADACNAKQALRVVFVNVGRPNNE